jgi:hypothetical protein
MPLFRYVLQTPKHKKMRQTIADVVKEPATRRSPRLKEKKSNDKSISSLAQSLLAKKLGIVKQDDNMEEMTLQHYLDLYKQPLTEHSMEAIKGLTEVAMQKAKKKKKQKKNKPGSTTEGKEVAEVTEAGASSALKAKKKKKLQMKGKKQNVAPEGAEA